MENDEENECMYFMEGNMWCAVRFDFTDLQESCAGFGETKEDALKALIESELAFF